MRILYVLFLLVISATLTEYAQAQNPDSPQTPVTQDALRVFLDCNSRLCDFDFFRKEITFVNYVRDRQDADVHVLVSTQPTGGGGTEFTLRFIGLRRFAGRENTLRYTSRPTDSEDQIRRGLARVLKAGLVGYAVDTPVGERVEIGFTGAQQNAAPATPARDPWNFWTFSVGVNGFFQGEQAYNSMNINASASANRTTETLKVNLSANNRYNESNFELSEENTVTNIQRNFGVRSLVVRSLTSRWSAGGRASATSSTFLNQRLALRVAPAVEYNIYPYSESTQRQLTFQYSPGVNFLDYEERTIFEKLEETRLDQSLTVSLALRQPWGSVNTSLEGAHYLHDIEKNRVQVGGGVNLRLIKGLQFNVGGSAERVRDQLFLPAGQRTPEEILLRQRQLETAYRYFGSVGLSYTFGSPFNNVVNPRFGNTGGSSTCFCF